MSTDPEELSTTSLLSDLSQLDKTFDETDIARSAILDKLKGIIQDIKIDAEASPRVAEVQLQLINTYLGALGAKETSITRRVTTKMKQKELNGLGNSGSAIASLLLKIDLDKVQLGTAASQPTEEEKSKILEEAFEKHNLAPITDTELRTDSRDVD